MITINDNKMKKYEISKKSSLRGGARATAIIGGIACVASTVWPIGTIIFGPTCAGMILATALD